MSLRTKLLLGSCFCIRRRWETAYHSVLFPSHCDGYFTQVQFIWYEHRLFSFTPFKWRLGHQYTGIQAWFPAPPDFTHAVPLNIFQIHYCFIFLISAVRVFKHSHRLPRKLVVLLSLGIHKTHPEQPAMWAGAIIELEKPSRLQLFYFIFLVLSWLIIFISLWNCRSHFTEECIMSIFINNKIFISTNFGWV